MSLETPTLELDGARLRPLRPEDGDAIHAYLGDPAVIARTSYPNLSREDVDAMLGRYRARWAAGAPSKWAIVAGHADRAIGTCGFNDWSDVHRSAELAYELAPRHWGRGLASRAVDAVLAWAFATGRIDRVQAYARVDNDRSIALLERRGFSREGRLRAFRVCRGDAHDFFLYALLRTDPAASASSADSLARG